MTMKADNLTVGIQSPIEGVITSINRQAIEDPTIVTRDPYRDEWIATIKSPDFAFNRTNLLQGVMVAPWMQNSVSRLNTMIVEVSPTLGKTAVNLLMACFRA